jgi:hypothetical protein
MRFAVGNFKRTITGEHIPSFAELPLGLGSNG